MSSPDVAADHAPMSESALPASFHLPDTLAGLRGVMGEALRLGILLHAEDHTESVKVVADRIVALAEDAVPEFFGEDSPYRGVMIAAVRSALELGIAARRAREDAEAGRDLGEDAPARFMGAIVPPDPIWLAEQAEAVVHRAADSLVVEGIAMPGTDVYMEGVEDAEPAFSTVDEDGTHRIRSHWMRDVDEQQIYQMVVLRRGRELTVLRRYMHQAEYTPVIGGYNMKEARFLYRALQEIFRQEREEESR